jgi:hypothetical protein
VDEKPTGNGKLVRTVKVTVSDVGQIGNRTKDMYGASLLGKYTGAGRADRINVVRTFRVDPTTNTTALVSEKYERATATSRGWKKPVAIKKSDVPAATQAELERAFTSAAGGKTLRSLTAQSGLRAVLNRL